MLYQYPSFSPNCMVTGQQILGHQSGSQTMVPPVGKTQAGIISRQTLEHSMMCWAAAPLVPLFSAAPRQDRQSWEASTNFAISTLFVLVFGAHFYFLLIGEGEKWKSDWASYTFNKHHRESNTISNTGLLQYHQHSLPPFPLFREMHYQPLSSGFWRYMVSGGRRLVFLPTQSSRW